MAKKADKRREKARQRKAARRKEKRSSGSLAPRGKSRGTLRLSASWPLHEAWLTQSWKEPGQLVQILVARRSAQDDIAVGTFLVDLGCLGVKSAFGRILSPMEYGELRATTQRTQEMAQVDDLNLLAKIVREGVAYAQELGFKPDPDYRDALLVLGDADPDLSDVEIPLGKDGKPFFVAGPHDNVEAIMTRLTRKCGPDGFHYLVPMMGPGLGEDREE
ncbi:MAG TPA: hypothetical protein VLC95_07340 [Anaerolineae bacterium]|nr:hypothetical protein [Anaerolineae bacterium]